MHRYVRWLHLLAHLTHQPLSYIPLQRQAAGNHKNRKVIIHPFASTRTRQPSVDWFAQLIEAIPAEFSVALSCGPGDLERNPDFSVLLDNPRVTLDTSSLSDKAAWIGNAALVIAVDTSVMHLAVIFGAPTLCIASAAHIIDSVPYDQNIAPSNVKFIVLDVDCAGCLGQCRYALIEGRYPCLQNIDVQAVIPEALKILNAAQTS